MTVDKDLVVLQKGSRCLLQLRLGHPTRMLKVHLLGSVTAGCSGGGTVFVVSLGQ